jgi:hypothetical protein
MAGGAKLIAECFPDLARELVGLLRSEGRADLADQVDTLYLVDRCRCRDDFCATFYTSPRPTGAWGPGHETVALDPSTGYLNVDVLNGRVVSVEVLYRDAVRASLDRLLP